MIIFPSPQTPQTQETPKLSPEKIEAVSKSVLEKMKGIKECNWAVNAFAQALGYQGFQGAFNPLQADMMLEKMRNSTEWKGVTYAEAIQLANSGQFVLGGLTGKDAGSTNGHVFVVLPNSKAASNWGQMRVLEARHNQFGPRITTGNWAIRATQRTLTRFFVWKSQ